MRIRNAFTTFQTFTNSSFLDVFDKFFLTYLDNI